MSLDKVKGLIFESELVANKNPRPQADTQYVVAYLQKNDGARVPLLLTDFDLTKAEKRAKANSEDVPPLFTPPEPTVGALLKALWKKIVF